MITIINHSAGMPEWSKGDDLRSSIERCVGSNPTPSIFLFFKYAPLAQLVRACGC